MEHFRRTPRHTALILLALGTLSQASATSASTIESTVADEARIGDLELTLYSTAVKKATFMKVKVYAVGLYVNRTVLDPDQLSDPRRTKAFVLTFLRDVERKKLAECFLNDFRRACDNACEASLTAQAEATAGRLPDIAEGDRITYLLLEDEVHVLVNDLPIGQLEGETASRVVLDAFIGERAPADLRRDLRTSRRDLIAARD